MRLNQNSEFALNPNTLAGNLAGLYARKLYSGRVYAKAQNVRPAYVAAYDAALADNDVLVMPTTLTQAPVFEPVPDRIEALELALFGPATRNYNTMPFNYTGHPALAVPTEKRNGLPVSIQFVGKMFADDLLLRVGQAYSDAVPFADHLAVED
jgi:amidase